MAAKGRIVNTTPKGKHSLERTRFTVIHTGGTFSRGYNKAALNKSETRAGKAAIMRAKYAAFAMRFREIEKAEPPAVITRAFRDRTMERWSRLSS